MYPQHGGMGGACRRLPCLAWCARPPAGVGMREIISCKITLSPSVDHCSGPPRLLLRDGGSIHISYHISLTFQTRPTHNPGTPPPLAGASLPGHPAVAKGRHQGARGVKGRVHNGRYRRRRPGPPVPLPEVGVRAGAWVAVGCQGGQGERRRRRGKPKQHAGPCQAFACGVHSGRGKGWGRVPCRYAQEGGRVLGSCASRLGLVAPGTWQTSRGCGGTGWGVAHGRGWVEPHGNLPFPSPPPHTHDRPCPCVDADSLPLPHPSPDAIVIATQPRRPAHCPTRRPPCLASPPPPRAPPTLCSGACGTCAGRVLSGEVEQVGQHLLNPGHISAGFALMCSSYPRSDCEITTHQEEALLTAPDAYTSTRH